MGSRDDDVTLACEKGRKTGAGGLPLLCSMCLAVTTLEGIPAAIAWEMLLLRLPAGVGLESWKGPGHHLWPSLRQVVLAEEMHAL